MGKLRIREKSECFRRESVSSYRWSCCIDWHSNEPMVAAHWDGTADIATIRDIERERASQTKHVHTEWFPDTLYKKRLWLREKTWMQSRDYISEWTLKSWCRSEKTARQRIENKGQCRYTEHQSTANYLLNKMWNSCLGELFRYSTRKLLKTQRQISNVILALYRPLMHSVWASANLHVGLKLITCEDANESMKCDESVWMED